MGCEDGKLAAALFNAVPAGIVVVDSNGAEIIDINPAACIMIGVRREDVIGKSCSEFLCSAGCDGCPVMTGADALIENKEVVMHRKDGSSIYALLTISSILLNKKRLYINSIIDITRQKEAEAELDRYWSKAREMLEQNLVMLRNGGESAD